MTLHSLRGVTIGVPDPEPVAAFYSDFGLAETGPGALSTTTGGEQLRLVEAERRRLVGLEVGTDGEDDLRRIAEAARRAGLAATEEGSSVTVAEPSSDVAVTVTVASRPTSQPVPAPQSNGPGRTDRPNRRADVLLRTGPVRPRRLSHVVLGTPDQPACQSFFTDVIGFAVSDEISGSAAFLRCSTDHHNLLVQRAPVTYLHHTAWQVDDFDEVGRGAMVMLASNPDCHIWGPGRHWIGSNFFWYLRDPAGNFAEYAADLDVVTEPDEWKSVSIADSRALFAWGPPPPAAFLMPADVLGLGVG